MAYFLLALIMTSSFSVAIMVSRRFNRVAWAYPAGIVAGMAMMTVLVFGFTMLISLGVITQMNTLPTVLE